MEIVLVLLVSQLVGQIDGVLWGWPRCCYQYQIVRRYDLQILTGIYGLIGLLLGLWTTQSMFPRNIMNKPDSWIVLLSTYISLTITPPCWVFWSKLSHRLRGQYILGRAQGWVSHCRRNGFGGRISVPCLWVNYWYCKTSNGVCVVDHTDSSWGDKIHRVY